MTRLSLHPGAASRVVDYGWIRYAIPDTGPVLADEGGGWHLLSRSKVPGPTLADRMYRGLMDEAYATAAYRALLERYVPRRRLRNLLHIWVSRFAAEPATLAQGAYGIRGLDLTYQQLRELGAAWVEATERRQ